MNDLDRVIQTLDYLTGTDVCRITLDVSDTVEEGKTEKTYHHGRCDVGSPFATGQLFDLEDNM